MSWLRRLINLTRPSRLQRDIDRELAFHVDERVDELMAGGMSEADARREARRQFGNREVLRERVHDVDVLAWLESVLSDVRFGMRALRANPGFTLVAVLSLGLGIGANTAIFSLINTVMLRSLPVRHPEQLVRIAMGDGNATFTNPLWEQVRDRQDALAGTFAFSDNWFDLSNGGVVRRATGAFVSGDYFNVLGVAAAAGRILDRSDDVRGCSATAVLGYGFWEREYGSSPDAVGRTISLDGHPFEIVGVVQPGFSGIHVGRAESVFVPLCAISMLRSTNVLEARSTWFLNVFGRLEPRSTLQQVGAGLATIARAVFESAVPTHWSSDEQQNFVKGTLTVASATTGMSVVRGRYRNALFVLLMVVGVVLLIACANVAQLLLARATARHHEIAVRLALGSGRARLARQLLTESFMLALLGAGLGVLFARWSSGLVVGLLAQSGQPVSLDLSLDLRVLGFTIAVAAVTSMLFGLAPAWRATRISPQTAMRSAGRGLVGDSRHRFAKGIVVGQVALSLVLVVAAVLLVGSFRRLATMDPGFRRDGVLVVSANWGNLDLSTDVRATFPRTLLERVRPLPGVRYASASLLTPISGTFWNDFTVADGFTPQNRRDALVWFNGVTDGYLQALGTTLLAGRNFTPQDRAGAAPIVMVNQTLAHRFFGDANPLGKHMRTNVHDSLGPVMEIVGVVADAKYGALDEATLPTAYVPLGQADLWAPSIELALRTDGAPSALIPAVTAALGDVNPAIALQFTTLSDQVAVSLARPRLLATLSGFFGGLALLLAVIGLYGTMSYSVARRRNEIGVRIALGAARRGILRMVAREAGMVIAIGILAGALLALAATRVVAAFLYGVTATDPETLVLSALALAVVAMGAGLVPAWRAATVDPMVALREE